MADEKEESFAAMFEREKMPAKRPRMPRVGDRIEGVVVRVGKDSVFVELDGKRQAFLETVELGGDLPKEGDTIAATVVEADEMRGIVRLGRSMGRPGSIAELEQARAAGLGVDGKITGVNKGGLEVDV
ncbi:MAG TPA: S1 RNA-binding domain-containing protein, partial [Labilithrix sp.]